MVARHSESTPASRAARVWGISCTNALAMPRWVLPVTGASSLASAISEANPRPRFRAGVPAACSAARRAASARRSASAISLSIYVLMAVAGAVALIWRMKLAGTPETAGVWTMSVEPLSMTICL